MWVATLALALAVAAAAPLAAGAAEGLFLTWNDCALGGTGSSNRNFACNTDQLPTEDLYCEFTLPAALDSVLGVEIVVDIQHSALVLPDWWRFDPGGCREASLVGTAIPHASANCMDPWAGGAAAGLAGYFPTQPRGGSGQARIKVTASLPSNQPRQLDATSTWFAARLAIDNRKTFTPPVCDGCATGACLVLNSILIRRIPGAPGGDLFLQVPGPLNANRATWQGGGGADCTTVPVRNRTWGQLKSLYR